MTDIINRRLGRRGVLAGGAALIALPLLGTGVALAASVADVKAKGTITIGIQGDNQPWGFVNSSGVQDGYDADVSALFGKELGVKVEFVPLAVANRIPALVTGKVDILFATMSMTAERAKSMQYSEPYAANDIILAAATTTKIASAADLAGLTIGVPRSSAQDTAVTKAAPTANILRFDDDAATIQALVSGQVQAVGGNQFYPLRLNAATKPGTYERKLTFFTTYNGAGSRLGEKDWNQTLNAFIDKIKANGDLEKIYQKWMGAGVPKLPDSIDGVPYTVQ
jgi:polar amino acid transport system substrate-binding protein